MTPQDFQQATVSDPSSSIQPPTGPCAPGEILERQEKHPPYTAPQQPPHGRGEAAAWPFTRSLLPSPQPGRGSRGTEGIRQLGSLWTLPQSSRPRPPEECRDREAPARPAPSHRASPSRKGMKSKTGIYFCEVSERLLLGAAVLGALGGPPGLTAGRCSLLAARGAWPRRARMCPRSAGTQWQLGGTCSSSRCPLSSTAPPPAGHSQGLSGLVRPSAETFCCPTQTHTLNQAGCSTHSQDTPGSAACTKFG